MRRIVLLVACACALAPPASAGVVVEAPVPGTWRDITPPGWGGGTPLLATDPAVPGRVYATVVASDEDRCPDVVRSEDAGRTWTAVAGVCDVVPDGRRAGRVYGRGLRRWVVSDEAGRTWRPLPRRLASGHRAPGRLVAIVPLGPGEGLAGIVELPDPRVINEVVLEVWRAPDGRTWQRVRGLAFPAEVVPDPALPGGLLVTEWEDERVIVRAVDRRGRVARRGAVRSNGCRLIIDQRRPNRLFCGGAQSDDGGRRWHRLRADVIGLDPVADRVYAGVPPILAALGPLFGITADDVLLARTARGRTFDPDGAGLLPLALVGAGVLVRTDGAQLLATPGAVSRRDGAEGAWVPVPGPFAAVVTDVAAAPGALVVGAVGQGALRSRDGGASWDALGGPALVDAARIATTPGLPDVVVTGFPGVLFGFGGQAGSTTDGGGTWRVTGNVQGPFAFVPGSRARVLGFGLRGIGPNDGAMFLLASTTSGRTWRRVAPVPGLPLEVAAAEGGGPTWVMADVGGSDEIRLAVFVADRGAEALRPAFPEDGPDDSTSPVPVPGEPFGAFASATSYDRPAWNGVFRTRDAGRRWTRVLPGDSAALAAAPGRVIACTDAGRDPESPSRLLLSADDGATWRPVAASDGCDRPVLLADGGVLDLGLSTGIVRRFDPA